MPLIQFLTKIENYISWSIVAEFPETGEWDEWEGDDRNYNNYDAVSLDSKSAFAPSCNFIFNADEVDVSVSLDDITGEIEITRSVRDFSDCDSDNNLPQSEEIVHSDLVIFSCSYFYTYPTTLTWLTLKTASY